MAQVQGGVMKKLQKPTPSLLCKLASIAQHTEEAMSAKGHVFDQYALKGLLGDPEVKKFLYMMEDLGLLPVKR